MATATPYLAVHDGKAAIAFYAQAFGAVEVERYENEDGSIGHVTLTIDGATIFLSDEAHEYHAWAPKTLGGRTTCSVVLDVDDVDASFARAVAAGATIDREPRDPGPDGYRRGWILDPFGHHWAIESPAPS
ncbi:Glyoxalase/bleomycin resistance protein/dioxygenase [Beutenbergia cavernae DSM 12333]|uniref:Glyoxalase/bleomycin resistance protein/dioxygenase n=1 Tax=Beutenbergia cavernae (strain ATCC BAA-8 / DSM 12333 / CCUG 43141 / JCM 11478 / NBRC 16432 / NCIMB 13614 / HKI 0122) TaxID=471853 RepID=C5C308_BEUC1|nr:VOC family protein [Beutenbergia cavernae]ACQ81852.1 Glyoxalase/bleomycin resistance protein/dioxygenase [Beutenbergia cavernae DSM 12333]